MVREAIQSILAKFVDALNRGDAAGIASIYTEDAKLLPPNNPIIIGKQAIQEFWQGSIEMGIKGGTLETIDLDYSGDLACEVGVYSLDIQPEAGQVIKDVGKYIVIWKKQADGSWKYAVDMFNSDFPPPT